MNDDDLDAELDAYLDDTDLGDLGPLSVLDELSITELDERRVSAMVARRQRLLAEAVRIADRVADRVAPIYAWQADRSAGIEQQIEWIDRQLERFTRETLPTMHRKSLPLPAGTLKLTAPGAPSLVVTDEGEFVAWAIDEHHPDRDELLRRTVALDKAEIKRRYHVGPKIDDESTEALDAFVVVDSDGEVVPGVRFTKPAQPRFSVTPPAHNQSAVPTREDTPDDTDNP